MKRLVAFIVLAALVISGCAGSHASHARLNEHVTVSSPTNGVATRAAPSTATPTQASSPTTAVASVGDSHVGTIVQVIPAGGFGKIRVVEHPDNPNGGEQYIVEMTADTRINARLADVTEPRTVSDLIVGKRVAVSFCGAVATSYPEQGLACGVTILRSQTNGPADLADTVTVTFVLYLFSLNGEPPHGDEFFVSYGDAASQTNQLLFCKPCRVDGAQYEARVAVPRGSTLSYTVYRRAGLAPGRLEVVEAGWEILDADMTSQSHYRYGAMNPGGYDGPVTTP